MTAETIRTFICFEIGKNAQDYLANIISGGKKIGDRIAWSKPQNIHLTLKFLGDISSAQIAEIGKIIKEIATGTTGFNLTIDHLGAFPNFRTPRVFWVGSSHIPAALSHLVAGLEEQIQPLGFKKERRAFKPHLTLGRVKGRDFRETVAFLKNHPFEPQTFDCNEIILMRSDLQPAGALYTPIQQFNLQFI
ncbi:MAG: RNA 2',3'-cyclic phosphodiesterase [bacterium]